MASIELALIPDLVIKYFTAIQERDLEKIMPLFADNLDWYIPGNEALAPWLGRRSTKAEVETFFKLLWQHTEPISGSIDHLAVVGTVALTSGAFKTRMLQTDKVFESIFFTEITVENARIIKYRLLEEGFGLVEALIT